MVHRDRPAFPPRSRATASSLVLALLAFPACGSSESSQVNNRGGSDAIGGGTNGGSGVDGGTAGASTGGARGGSDLGGGGASNGDAAGSGGASQGGAGAAGSGGSGASSTRGCPQSAPGNGAPCQPPVPGLTCYYDDCGATGAKTKAHCYTAIPEIGNPQQLWMVEKFPCEPRVDCSGITCPVDQVCVIFQGGAQVGQCSDQSCGSGPLECNCVKSCYEGCVLSSAGNDVTFTCNTCSDIRGCP